MNISALDENGDPVDWWFVYKLPNLKNPDDKPETGLGAFKGTEYLYCDANSPSLPKALSQNGNILSAGALFNTLKQLRDAAANQDPSIGWFFYNDEFPKFGPQKPDPDLPPDNGDNGHSKGVLAFDLKTSTAFWILHSWPCFPSFKVDPPHAQPALNFGQTFLCITLKDVATLDVIAKEFHEQTQPQIIDMSLPKSLDPGKYPNLVRLSQDAPLRNPPRKIKVPLGAEQPSDPELTFESIGGVPFRLFAKSKDWLKPAAETIQEPKDLYSDLIGPRLGVDLEVETWQDGEPDDDSDQIHTTEDILFIDLRTSLGINAAWHFTDHDHSKWAVSKDPDLKDETDWVIVADINRVDSQFERGGCGIAFQNKDLAHSLHSIIDMTPPSAAIGKLIATDEEKAKANEKARDAKRAATIAKAPKKAAAQGTVTAKKASAKKALVKKTTARKPARKKSVARKLATKKTVARKPAARKKTARKHVARTGKPKRR